ncbi:hypothetical protein F4776DRAFT_261404 [Hypoxylon sp. NC0597]|nr:hypothetical protein F4776DRAFT_261404 [Hypoxylon sp. NC0597]
MPRPVETLDIALPAGHPLKRPVSNRNKQTAQRIYQLWNIWPWQLFPADSPHLPTVWTDNILDKLKTIALCTTLSYARRLLDANITDGQPLSLAVLNAVIDECKEESDTPRNPAVKSSKRKQPYIVVGHRRASSRHRDERGDLASSQGAMDQNDEDYEASLFGNESSQHEVQPGGRYHPLRTSTRRLRESGLSNRYSISSEPASPLPKRRKRRHHSTSTPLSFTYITPPESMPASISAARGHTSQSNPLLHYHLEDTRPTLSSDGIAAYFESVVVQLSSFFQEQRRNYEQAVEGARLQLRTAESRLVSLEDELDAVKKDIDELEQQKAEMERTLRDLLSIEKEEEQLAARRRELMMRRISASWRPSPALSSPDRQPQLQLPLNQTRASDELQSEIKALVIDRLEPNKKREADLKVDIASTKSDIEAARAQVDASAADLNAKSDELIRWRGFSNDLQDALIRRGFAEPAFMWEFGQKDTERRDHHAGFTPVLPLSRPATAAGSSDSQSNPDNNSTAHAGAPESGPASSPNLGITLPLSTTHTEGDRRHGSL